MAEPGFWGRWVCQAAVFSEKYCVLDLTFFFLELPDPGLIV